MAKFDQTEWKATQVRLTVFPTPDSNFRSAGWWQNITGVDAAHETIDKKRDSSLISGELEDGFLMLGLAPERIDWVVVASSSPQLSPPGLPALDSALAFEEMGPMVDVFRRFNDIGERWLSLPDIPQIARMAFGATLTHQEDDRTAAYQRLPSYLPIQVDQNWRDFTLQVNSPRTLPEKNNYGREYLNLLSRWSVLRLSSHRLGDQGFIGTASKYKLRLELDLNTPTEPLDAISGADLIPLFHGLIEAAQEIAREGITIHEQYKL